MQICFKMPLFHFEIFLCRCNERLHWEIFNSMHWLKDKGKCYIRIEKADCMKLFLQSNYWPKNHFHQRILLNCFTKPYFDSIVALQNHIPPSNFIKLNFDIFVKINDIRMKNEFRGKGSESFLTELTVAEVKVKLSLFIRRKVIFI